MFVNSFGKPVESGIGVGEEASGRGGFVELDKEIGDKFIGQVIDNDGHSNERFLPVGVRGIGSAFGGIGGMHASIDQGGVFMSLSKL